MNDNSYSNTDVKEEIKSHKDKKIIKKTTPKSLNTKDAINSSVQEKIHYNLVLFQKKKC